MIIEFATYACLCYLASDSPRIIEPMPSILKGIAIANVFLTGATIINYFSIHLSWQ